MQAGEIIIQSIDNEGSGGYDMVLTKLVSSSVNVPLLLPVRWYGSTFKRSHQRRRLLLRLLAYLYIRGKHNAILIILHWM
jgi:hypothetical protein